MATVNIEITEQREEDMLCGALEGGSNYWYLIDEVNSELVDAYGTKDEPFVTKMWRAIKDGKEIEIIDVENDDDEVLGKISFESIKKGEQIMAEKYPKHFMDMVNEEDDAITADIWFQLAVMEEVIFG